MPRTTSKPLCLNCGVSLRYNRGASFCSAPACKRANDRAYRDRLRAVAAVAPATKRCGGCDDVDRLVNATMYLLQTHDALKAVA